MIAFDTLNGAVDGIPLDFQMPDVPHGLLPLANQDGFNLPQIFGIQNLPDFFQFHAKFFHVLDHVESRILFNVVVAIAGLLVGVAWL